MDTAELIAHFRAGKRVVCDVPPYRGRTVVYEPRSERDSCPWVLLGTRYGNDEVKPA